MNCICVLRNSFAPESTFLFVLKPELGAFLDLGAAPGECCSTPNLSALCGFITFYFPLVKIT